MRIPITYCRFCRCRMQAVWDAAKGVLIDQCSECTPTIVLQAEDAPPKPRSGPMLGLALWALLWPGIILLLVLGLSRVAI
jgi:hypothetical protein